jgi:chromosome segregation ATPase
MPSDSYIKTEDVEDVYQVPDSPKNMRRGRFHHGRDVTRQIADLEEKLYDTQDQLRDVQDRLEDAQRRLNASQVQVGKLTQGNSSSSTTEKAPMPNTETQSKISSSTRNSLQPYRSHNATATTVLSKRRRVWRRSLHPSPTTIKS